MWVFPLQFLAILFLALSNEQQTNRLRHTYRPKRKSKFKELLKSKLKKAWNTFSTFTVHLSSHLPIPTHSRLLGTGAKRYASRRHQDMTIKRRQKAPFVRIKAVAAIQRHLSTYQYINITANTAEYQRSHRQLHFDSDSYDICINNCHQGMFKP